MTTEYEYPVSMNEPQQMDENSWLISWDDEGAGTIYYVYVNGYRAAITQATEYVLPLEYGGQAVVSVFTADMGETFEVFPPYFTLEWACSTGTDYYKVEQYVDSAWVEIARFYDDGRSNFKYQTEKLADCVVHKLRVTAVGTNGNSSTLNEYSALMVRHPDIPDVKYSFNADTYKITISEA